MPEDRSYIFFDDNCGSRCECNEELLAKNELAINVEYLIGIINSLKLIITKKNVQNQELEKIINDQSTTIQSKTEKNHTHVENNSNIINHDKYLSNKITQITFISLIVVCAFGNFITAVYIIKK